MSSYAEAGILRKAIRQAVTSRPIAWLSVRYLHRIDGAANRLSRGRFTFSRWVSGLPVVQLTTTGARTGLTRTTPVLGIPDGAGLIVIASNFGEPRHPAWYHNIRANPQVTVTAAGVTRQFDAVELTGEARDGTFTKALRLNPGWLRYRTWAGARQIPVLRLTPVGGLHETFRPR